MACCAFALFLLSQLLLPLVSLRDRIFGAPEPKPDAAVLWTPGAAAAPQGRSSSRRIGQTLAVAASFELALMTGFGIGAIGLVFGGPDAAALLADIEAIHTTICRALGIAA